MVKRSWSFKIPGAETADSRIALYEGKEVIERLQEELNAEREASATSATEALSMIFRLQEEKAELAMELGQYKRMVEEQMSHVEMSYAVLEDLFYQKEVEVTALSYQVEVYRSQLLRLGFSDLNSLDVKLQENDDHSSMSDRSQTPSSDLGLDLSIPVEKEVIEESLDLQRSFQDVYLEKIKKLDEQVKELADKYKSLLSESGAKQTRDRSGKRNRREYQAELQQLRQRVEQLERGKTNTETETSGVIKQEEISLPNEEPSSTLDTVESSQSWIDPTIISVQEAMLHFWF